MLKAIIFDLDGTIIDTETSWYVALRDLYQRHGVDLPLEIYAACIGTDLDAFDPYEYIVTELHVEVDVQQFRLAVKQRYDELMLDEGIRPGVLSVIDQAHEAGLKLAVASSSHREWVERHLNQLGILEHFDVIVTADDVSQVKPDPELYQQAITRLGISPQEAIAIEDSPNGATAAIAAGLYCLVTPNPITSTLPFDMPHRRLNSLDELTLHDLLT